MKKNEILVIYGKNYLEMTKEILRRADLAGRIPHRDARIGIKPNLLAPTPASYGGTTHPEVTAGIIEYLQENGYRNLVMLEGSWVGDKTSEAVEACGYRQISEKYGVEFIDTQKDGAHERDCAGMRLMVCDCVREVDFLINVPVLKGHCQTKITCALKNLKGLIPNKEKRRFHSLGLHRPIAHLAAGVRQDFVVADHICGDLDFEDGGHPVERNRVLAAVDPVLLDAYVCELLHYSVEEVPYVTMAAALGVGSCDLSKGEIIACNLPEDQREIRRRRRVVEVSDRVEEVESCSACYGYLIPALDRLKEEGLLSKLSEKICIGQGFRGRSGELGVGSCTRGFCHSLEGCPPVEGEIYDFLKAYLLK